jgi:hypothetical protein
LGVWCFCSGCSPASNENAHSLNSKFFARAEVIGSRGVGIGEFNKPRSVAVDSQNNAYVVDMTGRVQKFSPDGKFLLSWQMPETTLGKAKGMGRDREGNIVVVEPHYQRVNHFSPEGKLLAQWGCKGTQEGCFTLPRSVAVNSRGEILVSEYQGKERVQRRSSAKVARTRASLTGPKGFVWMRRIGFTWPIRAIIASRFFRAMGNSFANTARPVQAWGN